MGKELKIDLSFYLEMEKNETKEQATERFYKIFNIMTDSLSEIEDQESDYQIYNINEQEY